MGRPQRQRRAESLSRGVLARLRGQRLRAARGADHDDRRQLEPAAHRPPLSERARRCGRARRELDPRRPRTRQARYGLQDRGRLRPRARSARERDRGAPNRRGNPGRARSREPVAAGRCVHGHRRAPVQVGEGRRGSDRAARRHRRADLARVTHGPARTPRWHADRDRRRSAAGPTAARDVVAASSGPRPLRASGAQGRAREAGVV